MTAITRTEPTLFATSAGLRRRPRALTVALWIVTVAAAVMFLLAGWSKLAGNPQMVQLFATIGLGQWFRYLTGAIEVISAVALLVPSVALFGALALAATMIGATLTHLFIVGGSSAIPLALFVATSFIAWARWNSR